jgi:DNA segregation ATPase FtsK/SpoIIIE, S-DNA-T family
MERRARFLRSLPHEENPEKKVTSALVDRYLDLAPILLLVDEVQEYTEHEDKNVRDEFKRIFTRFARLGRSAGIIPVFCTQKPDAQVLPTAITGNCSTRFCLKVDTSDHVDQVLGTSAHKNGLKANLFAATDVGLSWHKGDGQEPLVVRSVYGLDGPAADELIAKARAIRAGKGMLTGAAAGEEPEVVPDADLLDDLRDVMDHPPAEALRLTELREALADLRLQTWGTSTTRPWVRYFARPASP